MRLDYRVLVGIGALALIVGGAFAFDVYAGGWNVTDGMASPFKYNAWTYTNIVGLHNYRVDPDGDFDSSVRASQYFAELASTKCPDILVEQGYPYYVKITDDGYLQMDEPQLYDTYPVVSGNLTYLYDHYTIALDVTIKTAADSFSYGATKNYEQGVADIIMRFNVALNPWVPRGTWNENWTVIGGWAGIMSMSVLDVASGVTQQPTADQPENVGHTIQAPMSKYAALNMWTATGPVSQRSFDNTAGLVGVPASVDGELTITLGAGAWTHMIIGGAWDSVLVYDTYVKYTVRVDICTTLLLQPLILGGQKPLGKPAGNSTAYVPEIPILSDLMRWWDETWADLFNNPATFVLMVITIVVVGAVVYFVVKLFFLRRLG